MSPSSPARRVSYVIPPPAQSVPRLVLPRLGADRHGSTTPLFIAASSAEKSTDLSTPPPSNVEFGVHLHPKHRLGVTSFALDTSTRLSGKLTPEGILYSGGRDGQILAHELGIGLKQRSKPYGFGADGKGPVRSWETITGWGDLDESIEEEQLAGNESVIPYENSWEIDSTVKEPSLNISFRQSVQSHSDWINDILLCNFNRTIVSCSSDETVKAWNPHDGVGASDTVVLGRHMDYVQCLAHSKQQKWVASGGFDRMIKLWDLNRERQDPIITLSPPEESNTKASVYAIATDAAGSFIASGSPEKVIRLWDPRSGKRTGKLVGHTDNIRSILISEDGRYVLTGSADASIKLWSLASANRCIHTFSHHTESVWSLQSSHPSLSIFYSGDRGGHVCRVDTEGCASLSEGECILLCKETPSADGLGTEGITSLKVLDDQFVWTATSSSTINCWRVPGTRNSRIDDFATASGDVETDTSLSTASDFANAVSPYGFSMDSIQPSTLRSRQRDSITVEKEGWPRSDSPSSLSDVPTRNVEPPSGSRSRNVARGSTLMHRESGTPLNPSTSSVYTATGPPHATPMTLTTLFGVPYQSLIRLSSPADGFASPLFGRIKDPDVATLYSAASIRSIPIPMRQLTLKVQAESYRPISLAQPPPGLNSVPPRSMTSMDGNTLGSPISTGQQGHKAVQSVDDIEDAARIAYETREIAPEAMPIRDRPDYVLQGTQGIVRSVMLNDRWHALTVDTMGHVGLWDIVRGKCVGMLEKSDVEKANECESTSNGQKWKWSPREALEVVRERIEGEAVVNAWCTVDSSIGNLMVHIESNRVFDAEIFADEAGYQGEIQFEEDHRLNIGKWVIGNLFASFVVQEKAVQAEPGYFVDTLTSEPLHSPPGLGRAGISRQGGPRHISLEARRIRSIAQIAASQRTPGTSASSAIASMTPALLPDLPVGALEKIAAAGGKPNDTKSTKPQENSDPNAPNLGETNEATGTTQSPSIGSPTPRVPHRSQTADESSPGHADYFTARRGSSVSGDENTGTADVTTGATLRPHEEITSPGAASTQPVATPTTPAISASAVASLKFMDKLKAFGKQKKTGGLSETTESSDTTAVTSNADAAIFKPPAPTVFELLMSKPLVLPTFSDVPPIEVNPMTGIIISQASSEAASGWAPVYRGLYSTQSEPEDVDILEQELPGWVLEFLLNNKAAGVVGGGGPGGNQKFNFMVVPWKGGDSPSDLPELLSNQSRLTASRFLRVRKILSYVKDKVDTIEKRKEADRRSIGEGDAAAPPSRTGTPRVPSPRSLRSSSRSSHEGASVPPHRPTSKPVPGASTSGTPPPGHTTRPRATSSSSSRSGTTVHHHHHTSSRNHKASRRTIEEETAAEKRPEELYELLCNGVLLPNEMTLAAVKQHRWKGTGELVMEYRRRDPPRHQTRPGS